MMNLLKKFSQNKIIYILIMLLIVLVPSVLNEYSEPETYAITIAISVDADEDGFEISLGVIKPKGAGSISSNLEQVSAKGRSIDESLMLISVKLGKRIGLAHCELIVVNEKLFNGDVLKYLDFFVRTNNLTTNSLLVMSKSSAKDVVGAIVNSNNPYSENLKNILEFNEKLLFTFNMNIENFYKAYFSSQSVALVTLIDAVNEGESEEGGFGGDKSSDGPSVGEGSGDVNLGSSNAQSSNTTESSSIEPSGGEEGQGEEESSLGGEDESGSGGGESGGSGGGEKKKELRNEGRVAVVKKGKKIRELTQEESFIYTVLSPQIRTSFMAIDGINMPEFKNARIVFEVFEKKKNKRWYFNNGVPVVKFNIMLSLKVDEINAETYTEAGINEISTFFTDALQQQISNKVRENFAITIENIKKHNTDNLSVYDCFHKLYTKQWKNYINSLDNENDYLYGVVFELDLDLKNKL